MKFLLQSVFALSVVLAVSSVPIGEASARSVPDGFTELTKRLSPAVVNISTAQNIEVSDIVPQFKEGSPLEGFNDFFNRDNNRGRVSKSLGSGFVIDASGYIVTNNHVIEGADVIEVIFPNEEVYDAKLLGRDPSTDLALLKIESDEDFPFVDFGDSNTLEVGEWVMAIGNPFGYGGSVSAGIVSAQNRRINHGNYDDFIQTDVAINKGNSGGPMFNMDGDVIGVNTAIISPSGGSVGISFSIPSDLAKSVVKQLRDFGETRRASIGIRVQEVDKNLAKSYKLDEPMGAIITSVVSGKPAEDAGLKIGDLITKVGNIDVPSDRDLFRIIAETEIGKAVNITVIRKRKEKVVSVTPERLKEKVTKDNLHGDKPDPDDANKDVMGISIEALSDAVRREHKIKSETIGVRVTEVSTQSAAAGKLKEGDIIEQVSFEDVNSPKEFEEAIKTAEENDQTVAFLVNRGGNYVLYSFETS